MDRERFDRLKEEFIALRDRWQASTDLNARIELMNKIGNVLKDAQTLIDAMNADLLKTQNRHK